MKSSIAVARSLALTSICCQRTPMASIEAAASTLSLWSCLPRSSKATRCLKQPSSSLNLRIPTSLPLSLRLALYPIPSLPRCSTSKSRFVRQSAAEGEVAVLENSVHPEDTIQKKKLYVVNLPFNLPTEVIKNRFGECGTVKDVEIIRDKDGRNRGYAFVTMASGEEAQAVIDKFNSSLVQELLGRTVRVEYAKKFKKPRPSPPPAVPVKETRHVLYVSNLQWKVRSTHLRDFFSASFNPVSARVVFDSPLGRSAGYGFVSFNTREEADAAISSCDGKELMGRPIRLKFSERVSDESGHERDGEETSNDFEDAQNEEEVLDVQP